MPDGNRQRAAAGEGGRRLRVALVLGSGGVVGGAYHAGVLKALNDTWAIDPRTVDLIVGTSTGAVAGALTAAGLHPNDLFRRETGKRLSPTGQALLSRGRARRGARPRARSAVGAPAAPEVVVNALTRPRGVALGSVAAALLPRGVTSTDHLAGMIEGILGDTWPDRPRLRVCAVELQTGRRVVFGPRHDPADLDGRAVQVTTSPARAVAASCAVPAVFAPVAIEGREYHDGGVHSADNLDLVGTSPFDLVVVSSPMSSRHPLTGDLSLMGLRTVSRFQTERERRSLDRVRRLEILRPTPADLDTMGSNMLDDQRRPVVAFQAHASTSARLAELAPPDLAG